MKLFFAYILILAISYLIGSINTSIIVGKNISKLDIRDFGSGNAGFTNTLRVQGKKAAIVVIAGDILKTLISIFVAHLVMPRTKMAVYLAGIGTVLGHNFPIYFGFKGGKGITVTFTSMLFANFPIGALVLAISLAIMFFTRYVSLGSVAGCALLVVFALIFKFGDWGYVTYALILGSLALFMHRGNLKRLWQRAERKVEAMSQTDETGGEL
jgi:glycerol-3-phosphate acyltransferase PlsY